MNNEEIFKLVKNNDSKGLESALNNGQIPNVNLKESGMQTSLLMTAVSLEIIPSVKILLDYGADPNIQDIYGKTVLHLLPEKQPIEYSSIENKITIANLLFSKQADLNIIDKDGGQPLWYSVFYMKKPEDIGLVEVYLKNGANPTFKNNGESALDKANKLGYQPLINLLESYK